MITETFEKLKTNISKVINGKDEVIEKILISFFCNGHILLEDIPGTGKTTLAKALAVSSGCNFKRIQFTPDLLPSEVTGINYFNQKENEFVFKKGPVFTNILLADEINRATPRTQSSLLECMEEKQISESGITYKLDKPFIVIATQNPVENHGTFPLPEAQLDRFFMKLKIGYPEQADENAMLKRFNNSSPDTQIQAVVSAEDILNAQEHVKNIMVSDDIINYITSIINATRNLSEIKLGVSPRGSLALLNAAKGHAAVKGNSYVSPDNVKAVAADVLSHRIILNGLFPDRTKAAHDIIIKIISSVTVPSEKVIL